MSKKEKLTKEQKKALKEEKKALKAENGADDGIKIVITRCVATVVSTAIVCCAVSSCTGKYADTLKELSESKATASDEVADSADSDSSDTSASDSSSEDTGAATDDTADAADDTANSDSGASSDTGSGSSSGSSSSGSKTNSNSSGASSGQMTNAQIIEYFNKAANDAKSNSKSITQLFCKNSQASKPEINNNTIKKLADSLISQNMGEDSKKANVTYSSAADKKEKFPVKNQSWSSKLTMSDVKSVTKTTSGTTDTVTIKLVDDTTPNITPGNGHAGKAFSIITKDQIVEGAGGAGMAVIKEESIKITFKDCRIIAKIDSKTGKLQNVNYYQTWILSLSTKIGLDVTVSFGLEEEFKINW